jgi:hypothetical protein
MGSGYRVFTAGEVLSASNVQNYLQDQAVMVFGGTAARSSAIGTANFEEGMLTYLTDVDKLQVYTGAAFADVYPAAATNQGLTLINTTSFSAVASQSVNDVFSATYDNYKIIVNLTNSTGANSSLSMRMRVSGADNTNNEYTRFKFYTDYTNAFGSDSGSIGTSSFLIGDTQGTDGNQSVIEMQAPFLTQLTKQITIGTKKLNQFMFGGSTTVTTSYTGFTLIQGSTNITGTVSVYGYTK